jgi:hypothetical protein
LLRSGVRLAGNFSALLLLATGVKSTEIDRLEKERRESALARHVCYQTAQERKEHRRPGNEQEGFEGGVGDALDL